MGSREELYDMLTAAISDEPKAAVVVRSVFSILRQHHLTSNYHIRQQALALIKSRNPTIQEEAIRLLMRSRPSAGEIRTIRSAAEAGGKFLAGVYVAEISHRLGQAYELVTRDPVSNASFSIVATLTPSDLNLIARGWLWAESSQNASDLKLPLIQRKGGANYFSLRLVGIYRELMTAAAR
jgi:hypothetical protein